MIKITTAGALFAEAVCVDWAAVRCHVYSHEVRRPKQKAYKQLKQSQSTFIIRADALADVLHRFLQRLLV